MLPWTPRLRWLAFSGSRPHRRAGHVHRAVLCRLGSTGGAHSERLLCPLFRSHDLYHIVCRAKRPGGVGSYFFRRRCAVVPASFRWPRRPPDLRPLAGDPLSGTLLNRDKPAPISAEGGVWRPKQSPGPPSSRQFRAVLVHSACYDRNQQSTVRDRPPGASSLWRY